jgi:hypothetical protein
MKILSAPKLALSICAAMSLSVCLAQSGSVVPPNETVQGQSQAEWSRAWWQWAGSFERSESPVADKTGEICGAKQEGPVWFLAGTYGTKRTIRTCTVPRNKYLFFPLINYVYMPSPDEGCQCTCDMVKGWAKEATDSPAMLVLEVDGKRVEHMETYRQATKQCFDMGARTPEKYSVFPSAANGYYVMLRPLAPGRHTLNFGGMLPRMSQAVTYTLIVQ